MIKNNELLNDFLSFVKIDTQSNEESLETPSTAKQYNLLRLLEQKLIDLGLKPHIDEFGRLYCNLEGNNELDAIGLCSHVDTALEESGKDVKPLIHENYDGSDLALGNSGLFLSSKDYQHLKKCLNKTIITTSGDTLLGADDKAGVAIIFDVTRKYLKLDVNKRHPLSILFTPDEEIGRGPEHFNLEAFRSKYAYTIDGDDPHLASYENFNAYRIDLKVKGLSIHPGEAKDKMINASKVLIEFINALPKDMTPEKTSGREGFNHLISISGEVSNAEATFILRNHDKEMILKQIEDFKNIQKSLKNKYPKAEIEMKVTLQYQNMLEIIKKDDRAIKHLNEVAKKLNYPLTYEATRGGTDGATFSFLGCPTPNLGTGSYNHHGRYEFAVLEEMEELSAFVLELFKA